MSQTVAVKRRLPRQVPLESLPPENRRVLIAQDLIQHIREGWVTPTTGTYLGIKGEDEDDCPNINDVAEQMVEDGDVANGTTQRNELQLSSVLARAVKCDICALGGLAYASIMRFNHFTVGDAKPELNEVYLAGFRKHLNQHFSDEQLSLIETAFEGQPTTGLVLSDYFDDEVIAAAKAYLDNYEDRRVRLLTICNNIIDNRGTFVP